MLLAKAAGMTRGGISHLFRRRGGPPARAHQKLLASLFRELAQTERSAHVHPAREARRLGEDTPPGRALRAVSNHAGRVLIELPRLAWMHYLPVSKVGWTLGEKLSDLRHFFIDRLVDSERSYRATLGGMQHGIDLVSMIEEVSERAGWPVLVQFARRWLVERRALVADAREAAIWFADHPQMALRHPPLLGASPA
jgi:AcrR family transcriptional regulator